MIHKLDEKGFALLTVVLLGAISMVLLSMVFVILTMSTSVSGVGKRYLTELESAKGASEFVMASLRNTSLRCIDKSDNQTACTSAANQRIFLPNVICTSLGKANCTGLTAKLLSEASFTPENSSSAVTVYAIEVSSRAANAQERATVEFVYKTF